MKLVKPLASPLFNLLVIPALICSIVILVVAALISISSIAAPNLLSSTSSLFVAPTAVEHIAFGIASNKISWPARKEFVKLWWEPQRMRGCVFLDKATEEDDDSAASPSLPPVCISEDTSRFHYTYKNGLRSAVRIARIVSETVNLNLQDVRWFVFGDDDTVFFPENLAKTLSKYDHELWYYVGSNSEVYEQNQFFSFDMAFGGAGFALSSSLAEVLAKVLDSCLERYPHLYGSDGRIASCLAELGVGLTHEPGFHQMDVRGDIFGLLASHPLTPLVSLHHLEHANPVFPNMTILKALHHLFQAVQVDSQRVLQKTVCYDPWLLRTISVSWGYAIEVFDCHLSLPDTLRVAKTFQPWKRYGANELSRTYMFSTRRQHWDPCGRPTVFYFDRVSKAKDGMIMSRYRKMVPNNFSFDPMSLPKKFNEVMVFSRKFELGVKQLQAPRRHCCDVLPPTSSDKMEINIRECKEDELTYLHA